MLSLFLFKNFSVLYTYLLVVILQSYPLLTQHTKATCLDTLRQIRVYGERCLLLPLSCYINRGTINSRFRLFTTRCMLEPYMQIKKKPSTDNLSLGVHLFTSYRHHCTEEIRYKYTFLLSSLNIISS